MTNDVQNGDLQSQEVSSQDTLNNDAPIHDSQPPPPNEPRARSTHSKRKSSDQPGLWWHPITALSFIILITVILLIGANVLNIDKGGTLEKLARIDYARGLITYLFAVGTIGTIIAIMLAILLGEDDVEEKIRRAKDVLTILIGIFGTIIGFYFGAQIPAAESASPSTTAVQLATPLTLIGLEEVPSGGGPLALSTTLEGGIPPYHYWIHVDSRTIEGDTQEQIMASFIVTPTSNSVPVILFIRDSAGNTAVAEASLPVGGF